MNPNRPTRRGLAVTATCIAAALTFGTSAAADELPSNHPTRLPDCSTDRIYDPAISADLGPLLPTNFTPAPHVVEVLLGTSVPTGCWFY